MKLFEKKQYISQLVKSLKRINESIFDDFYEDLEDETIEIGNMLASNRLIDCVTEEEIIEYFIKALKIEQSIRTIIYNVFNSIQAKRGASGSSFINKMCEPIPENVEAETYERRYQWRDYFEPYTKFWFNTNIWENVNCNIERPTLKAGKSDKTIEFPEIIYRNKPMKVKKIWFGTEDNFLVMSEQIYNPNPKVVQKIIDLTTEYNSKKIEQVISNTLALFNDKIRSIFNTKRLELELTSPGKVYKVVQKDIDRMKKCLETNNYTGFDLIKNKEKMAARLAALLIVNNKINKQPPVINDETLIRLYSKNDEAQHGQHTAYKSWRKSLYRFYETDVYRVLDKIRYFEDLNLKDILLTYNEYKDKF